MKQFWKYNKWKIFFLAAALFSGFLLFIQLFAKDDYSIAESLFPASVLTGIFLFIRIVLGVYNFVGIDTLVNDTSENSILLLYDAGYTIEQEDKRNLLTFTSPYLKGHISGYEVTIRLREGHISENGNGPAKVLFLFHPLSHLFKGDRLTRDISFEANMRFQCNKDIKPEVLHFVEELKAKGYTPTS